MRVRIDRHLQGLMKIHPGTAGLSALAKSVTAAASGGPVLPPEFTFDPTRAVVGLRNHGLTITGHSLDDIFDRVGSSIVPRVPME